MNSETLVHVARLDENIVLYSFNTYQALTNKTGRLEVGSNQLIAPINSQYYDHCGRKK